MAETLRVLGGDPGYVNYGLCLIELVRIDHCVNPEATGRRVLWPVVKILKMDTVDLRQPPAHRREDQDPDPAVTEGLVPSMGPLIRAETELQAHTNLPIWRDNLALVLWHQWAEHLMLPYMSGMTGRHELPVIVLENQLDVADEKTRDLFNRSRMYTLSQSLAGIVRASDAITGSQRLILNGAKKHAIASNGSLTYPQRKQRAIDVTRSLLTEQRDDPRGVYSDDIKANAAQWLRFMAEREAAGQKLDDMCDAFLMAIETAMKLHKTYHKKASGALVPPLCYLPPRAEEKRAARPLSEVAPAWLALRNDTAPPPPKKREPAAPKTTKRANNKRKREDTPVQQRKKKARNT